MEYSTDVPAAQFVGNLGIWKIFEVLPGQTMVEDPRPVRADSGIDPYTYHPNMYTALEYIRSIERVHSNAC